MNKIILATLAVLSLSVSCGIDEFAQFDNKDLLDTPRRLGEGEQRPTPSDDQRENTMQQPYPEDDDIDDDFEPLDPDTLVLHHHMRTQFDLDSAMRLVNNEAPQANLRLAANDVRQRLSQTSQLDGITIRQTFGDGISQSSGIQNIINTPGDQELDVRRGQRSASGQQTITRVTDDADCPDIFVCVAKLSFNPQQGDPISVCFHEPISEAPVSIPFANVPNYMFDDYEQGFGSYGPYLAKRYQSLDVDCENPQAQPDLTEEFVIHFSGQQLEQDNEARFFQKQQDLNATIRVDLQYERIANDNVAPYLDETVNLQMRTQSFIDTTERATIKMIKTVRSTVELPAIARLLMRMDGLMVNLHFELCRDFLKDQGGTYCDE